MNYQELNIINVELGKLIPGYSNFSQNPRQQLSILLTLIDTDIPLDLCRKIERILLSERPEPISLPNLSDKIVLYQGDITKLKVDAIVNAANSDMMGCFNPSHKCIDNIIHSKAGPRLRMECRQIFKEYGKLGCQGRITKAYCLPCKYIIHVVGPIYDNTKTQKDELALCYSSSLDLAMKYNLNTIAFCCISTGLYGYPKKQAANIAINTVRTWLYTHENYPITIIFDVFTEEDYRIYYSQLY